MLKQQAVFFSVCQNACRPGLPEEETIDGIDKSCSDESDEHAGDEVSGVMDTKVDAGIGVKHCPEKEEKADCPLAEEKGDEEGKCKGVGGVTGWEAITPAAFAVKDVYKLGDGVVGIGGAHALDGRPDDAGAHLVGKGDDEYDGNGGGGNDSPVEIAAKDVEEGGVHGSPREFGGDKPHEVVPIGCVHPVEGKEEFPV